jgi:dihydroorotate dehydrogenase
MLYSLVRPVLFSLDPETAHHASLRLAGLSFRRKVESKPVRVMGIDFPNPVGLAAGLDKHAEHVESLARLGFGFLELGGVTPRPQPGNPRPRLFRLPAARAIINRYGLNSVGVEVFAENLKRARDRTSGAAVIGVNIGKNKDTPNERAAEDYERCMEVIYPLAHYVSINISSPNTPGLRDLQSAQFLEDLLRRLLGKRDRLRQRHGRQVALVLKVSPDLDDAAIRGMADAVRRERIDGLIVGNTTVSREGVAGLPHGDEEGGLSGAPLRERATRVLRAFASSLRGEIPLIGCGGIMGGADAAERFAAGASLVQIYSGLVYRGPRLVSECVAAFSGTAAPMPAARLR